MILTQGEADVLLFNVCSASDITDSDKLFHSSDPRDSGDEHFSITFSKSAHYISFSKFLIYSGDGYSIHILPFSWKVVPDFLQWLDEMPAELKSWIYLDIIYIYLYSIFSLLI